MRARVTGLVVVGGLLMGGLAGCGDDDADGTSEAAADAAPAAGEAIFADPLDDDSNGWGVFDSEGASTAFEEGDYIWEFPIQLGRPHFVAETLDRDFQGDEVDLTNVVVEAEGQVTEGDATIGVFCRDVPDTQSDAEFEYYEFLVNDGFGAIRRSDDAGHIDVLADTDDVAIDQGQDVSVGGVCTEADDGALNLWLTLDGETLLQASDEDPLPVGPAGVGGYAVPDSSEPFVVRWHEFTVSAPEG